LATVEPTTPPPQDASTPSGTAWDVGLAAGGAIFAFGLYGLLHNATQTMPADLLKWIAGALILHDAIVAPATLVAGMLLTRLLPATIRAGMRATLAVCAVVVMMSVPVLKAVGRRPDNPSLLPHDYPRNLAIVIALILAGGTLLTLVRVVRAKPSGV
jgi:Na+-transporting NADH:ubiquinone oxidoreductase subunit NqrB